MFAVIDCGTTFTRIYIVQEGEIIASGRERFGVRNVSLCGSSEPLKLEIRALLFRTLQANGISLEQIRFMIASGMITSEDGLMEVPHLVAPVGCEDLAENMVQVDGTKILDIPVPLYFIPGVKNYYTREAGAAQLPEIDFMRGEEVQCMGILAENVPTPCTIVTLSSHTKIIHINENGQISASSTTISGQLFEALVKSTNIGKSIASPSNGEPAGGYSFEELADLAERFVEDTGLVRTLMMLRPFQLLLCSDGLERSTFADAAIAADDMRAFDDMIFRGYHTKNYIIYGQEKRCKMYEYLLKKRHKDIKINCISDKDQLDALTVRGCIVVTDTYFKKISKR